MRSIFALLIGCILLCPAHAPAQEQLPLGEFLATASKRTQMTEAEFAAKSTEFERASILTVFDARWQEERPWRADARAFLHDACAWLAGDRRECTAEEMALRANRLVDMGCADPLVNTLAYAVFDAGERGKRGLATLHQMNALERSDYPTYRKTAARIALRRVRKAEGASVETETREALAAIKEAIRTRSQAWDPHTREYVWRKLSGALLDDFSYTDLQHFHRDLGMSPQPYDPWLWNMTVGACEYRHAWHLRGGAFWDQIPEDRKVAYEEALGKAVERFVAAAELEPTIPDAPSRLLTIAVEGFQPQGKGADEWFRATVDVRFDCQSAFIAYLRNLQARWGGGPEPTLDFARACIATDRFDTSVPLLGLEAIEQLGSEVGSARLAWSHEQTAPLVDRALEGYLGSPTSPLERDYVLSLKAAALWWRNDFGAALAALPSGSAGHYLTPLSVEMTRVHPQSVVRDALALGGPHAATVQAAFAATTVEDEERTLRELDELIDEVADDAEMHLALRDVRVRIDTAKQLARGEWAEVPFAEGLPGWRAASATFTPAGDGLVEVMSPPTRATMLLPELWGNRVELEQTIDGTRGRGSWGFILAYRDDGYGSVYRSVLVHRPAGELRIGRGLPTGKSADLPELGDSIALRAAVWDHWVAVWVDGQQVYAGPIPGDSWQGWGAAVGIGGSIGLNEPSAASGFRLRILAEPPPELAALVQQAAEEEPEPAQN